MARANAQAEKLPDKEEREGVLAELAIDDRQMHPQKVFFSELNLPPPTMPLPTEVTRVMVMKMMMLCRSDSVPRNAVRMRRVMTQRRGEGGLSKVGSGGGAFLGPRFVHFVAVFIQSFVHFVAVLIQSTAH